MSHFQNLQKHIKDLKNRRMLDIGSGKGDFLIEIAQEGGSGVGIEINPKYIQEAYTRSKDADVTLEVVHAIGDRLPFQDQSFGFVNASELIEHVEDPSKLLLEICRVLECDGYVYISVPNRFGIKDQHFHLYFVNWLPRVWANTFIGIFGKHKDYDSSKSGLQNLSEMHYYTYTQARRFFESLGFLVTDMRITRIKNEYPPIASPLLLVLYIFLRMWYFDSFHLLLKKQ